MGFGLKKKVKKAFKGKNWEELGAYLREQGLENCDLIVGIDFTKSNTWNGGLPFYQQKNLHSLHPYPNPYQQVLDIMCPALRQFDDDGMIPAYGFGDNHTTNRGVFSLMQDSAGRDAPCYELEGVKGAYDVVVQRYNDGDRTYRMSGPTSFAPMIRKAIEIVQRERSYHILIIVCDGAIDSKADEEATIQAIIDASHYPLSIICIGVGRGDVKSNKKDPWKVMKKLDDKIPKGKRGRKFDNFQFVPFHEVMGECENEVVVFAEKALEEIPKQNAYCQEHLLSNPLLMGGDIMDVYST